MVDRYDGTEADAMEDGDDYFLSTHLKYADRSKENIDGKYRCSMCGVFKPKKDYYTDKRVPCGVRSRCKACYHKRKGKTS